MWITNLIRVPLFPSWNALNLYIRNCFYHITARQMILIFKLCIQFIKVFKMWLHDLFFSTLTKVFAEDFALSTTFGDKKHLAIEKIEFSYNCSVQMSDLRSAKSFYIRRHSFQNFDRMIEKEKKWERTRRFVHCHTLMSTPEPTIPLPISFFWCFWLQIFKEAT